MQISLLTVVTFMNVLVSAESTFMRGGSTNSDKDTNSNHRSLALSECSDSEEVLYKDKTCDWISAINNKKKMKNRCNKKTKLGRIYDLCPSTCSGVDLGPCTTSKLGETINALRAAITDFETPSTDEDENNDSVAVNAEKVAVLEERIGELEVAEKLFLQEQESLDSLRAEKVAVTAEKEDLKAQVTAVNKENVLLVEAEYTANEIIQDLVATKVAVIEEKDTLEAQVTAVNKKNDDLKARVDELMEAELRSKLEFRTDQPSECGTCNGCLKPGDCNNDDYNQTSCEQIDLVWCGTPSTTTSTASDCNAVTEEKDALEAQVTAVNKEKDNLMARVNELVDTERLFIQEQESLDATTQRFIDSLRAEKDDIIAEKYELKETIESLREEKNAAEEQLSSFVEASSNCTAVTAENDDFKAQVTTIIAEKVVLEDRVTAVNKEKDDLMARVDELVEAERLFIEKQISLDTNTMMVIKALGVEKDAITAEKDEEIVDLENEIAVLKASLANTDDPTTAPTTLAATNVDYTYADFYNSIENEPIVDTADSLTSCSSYAGGDCSRTPTYCYSVEGLEARQAGLFQEIKMHESDIKMLESDIKMLESEKIPLEQLPGGGPILDNNIVDCHFSRRLPPVQPAVEKYGGSCSGTNSCLNLDFYCVSSTVCELDCSGGNSCKGVTMYCADNQVCAIKLCGGDRCVGAKVVYNGMEFGEKEEWKSPPAEEYRESRFFSF